MIPEAAVPATSESVQSRTSASASQANLERLLSPRSIALVGASDTSVVSQPVMANLLKDFDGPVYPVNPRRPEIMGVKAYPTVTDLPEAVDLAIVAVPAAHVVDVVEGSVARGIGSAVVLSAGFAEVDVNGRAAQQRLTDLADEHSFPIIGPNCNGFLNGHGHVAATFAIRATSPRPKPGPIALVSQSGGFGSYIMLKAIEGGLKVGWYMSTGNECDVNVARSMRYIVEQPEVKVILTFFEGVRSPEIFVEAAERALELGKSIVAVKAGYTEQGARAALSHTASIAGSGAVYDAVCEQYGILRATSVEQLVDFGLTMQTGRRMRGRGVGLLTQSGGSGVLMADEAERVGLDVPSLSGEDLERVSRWLPPTATGVNPVDTTGLFDTTHYGELLSDLTTATTIDATLALIWYVRENEVESVRQTLESSDKPVVVALAAPSAEMAATGVPVYSDPLRAVRALGALADYSSVADNFAGAKSWEPNPERRKRVRALLESELGRPFVLEGLAKRVLAEYGITGPHEREVHTVGDAVAAAADIGGPVALKVLSYELPHKSDSGGIRLGIEGAEAVEAAFEGLVTTMGALHPTVTIDSILVQQMVPADLEFSCGIQRDPIFGPVVVISLGGVLVEIIEESALLRAPFTLEQARHTVSKLAGGRLVRSSRGLSEQQVATLARTMVGLGDLALELPELQSADVNPVRVSSDGTIAADALLVLTPADPRNASPEETQ